MILPDETGKDIMEEKRILGPKKNVNTFNFPVQQAKGVYFVQIANVFNRTVYSQQLIFE